ncbi:unnamed protein product [Mytilus coruscus]|uniref:Uncharacterized protein n=1 Tax=Mytilus coruscus TaxID=42192 RepID=A0A6J8AHQ0_MYTCO|nr:unnamed protein product [Mytilus coruscus]
MWSIWIVALCLIQYGYTQTVPGVCPPVVNSITDCSTAKFSSNCRGGDSNCEEGLKCCPTECGSQNCRKPLLIQRPGCPVEDFLCIRYLQLCKSDQDCQLCCYNPSCGTSCKEKVEKILSPDVKPFSDCPLVKCSDPCPSGFEVDKNRCQTCQCLPEQITRCNVGKPLKNVFCGRNQPPCPPGHYCEISPFMDTNGICCKGLRRRRRSINSAGKDCPLVKCSDPCPSGFEVDKNGCQTCQCLPEQITRCNVGKPLKNVFCGRNQPPCPPGHHCEISPFMDTNGICCKGLRRRRRGINSAGKGCNVGKPLKNVFCGRNQPPCPPGHHCEISPFMDTNGICCKGLRRRRRGINSAGKDCPPVKCLDQCPSGFEVDENGCQTCQCLIELITRCNVGKPLKNVFCGRNQPPCPPGHHCEISPFMETNGICCKGLRRRRRGINSAGKELTACLNCCGAPPCCSTCLRCDVGKPLNNVFCSRNQPYCPARYHCKTSPLVGTNGICCKGKGIVS